MEQTTIDGVTTFWEAGPAPLSATLMFRAGVRHETLRTRDVAHLVEHLAMSTLPRNHLDKNASVDVDFMQFYATGPVEQVVEFLHGVCRGLTSLPIERIERETKVLAAEDGQACAPHLGWAHAVRSGPVGAGLLGEAERDGRRPTAEHALEFVRAHCVAANAALVLNGPIPEGLRLDLPQGPRPPEPLWRSTGIPTPGLVSGAVPVVALSYVQPRDLEAAVMTHILIERIEQQVRHELGLAYEVGEDGSGLTQELRLVSLSTDGAEEDADEIAHAVWGALNDLAQNGPTVAELDHEKASYAAYLADPRSLMGVLELEAARHLRGATVLRERETRQSAYDAVTADQVREWARQARSSALFGVPEALETALAGVTDISEWEPPSGPVATGREFRRKLTAIAPRDLRVVIGDEGLSITASGHVVSGRWAEVVGVARAPGFRFLLLESGDATPFFAKHLKDGDQALALIDARTADVSWDSTLDAILEDL